MLITVPQLRWIFGVRAHGVLHVGAHDAEECTAYRASGWGDVIWVEMLPEKAEALKARFAGDGANIVLHAACWDSDGVELPIFRADNDQSSSLLAPALHLTEHPRVAFAREGSARTTRLDSILPQSACFDFIAVDVQGAELRALRGLGERLRDVTWAFLEVNERPLYEGCALLPEIDSFMAAAAFVRIALHMTQYGWGDALYVNTERISKAALAWLRAKALLWGIVHHTRLNVRAIRRRLKSSRAMS